MPKGKTSQYCNCIFLMCYQFFLPAVWVFVSAGEARIVLDETEGLHFPPNSDQTKLGAYEPSLWTAVQTPDEETGIEEHYIIRIT